MTVLADLIDRLRALDVHLTLDGDRLSVNAPKGALSAELKAELSDRKDELKRHLAHHPMAPARNRLEDRGIVAVPRRPHMPVSNAQQRLWFMQRMAPTSTTYNVTSALRMHGDLDVAALERGLSDLVARHESLRTRFVDVDGAPRCVIDAAAPFALRRADVSTLAEPEREAAAMRQVMAVVEEPFDIAAGPMFRVVLVRVAARMHIFCLVVHHIVADGLSVGVMLFDLQSAYAAHRSGAPVEWPALAVQAVDHVEWQRRGLAAGALDKHLAYWKEQLRDLPPVLSLPTDRPRPRVQTFNGASLAAQYDARLSNALKALCRAEGVTFYMALMAVFQVLLHRYTGEQDIAIGSVIGGRDRPEMERVVGFFANSVVHRANLSGNPTLRELFGRVRATAAKSYAHQDMPFDVLVEALSPRRDLDHSPLFQVQFVVHNAQGARYELAGVDCDPLDLPTRTSRFDLAVDVFDGPDGPRVFFEYNTDLFDAATIARMMTHYRALLEATLATPDARIAELPMLGDVECRQLVVDWNRTRAPMPEIALVHDLFEAQCKRTPTATALAFDDHVLCYTELNERANRLAHHLRSIGVGNESLVGVWLDRGTDMVVALLGILKAGGAYVPLDPAFPRDRIAFMASDAQLQVVVTQAGLGELLPEQGLRLVCIDTDWPQVAQQAATNLALAVAPSNLAYVIYTSGSTGLPKGVQVEHRSVVNFLASMQREPGIDATDHLVSVTTLSFDIAGLEIFGPLTVGGTVVLASRSTALDAGRLAALLRDSGATLLQATPATWRLLVESEWPGLPHLKMLCGGEALPRELAERLLALGGELWNMYGPTETTIWSTLSRVSDATRTAPIGRPIANTTVYVLEPSGLPAPIGIAGELCIGGAGLARGYRNRPELTAEKFVVLELPDGAGGQRRERVYRTGDMARFRADGQLEFLGRRDQQVKLRGFRIELGEIESVLASHTGVQQVVTTVREDTPGDQRLVAYVVPVAGTTFDETAARTHLRVQLPDYMIPQFFMTLEALPLTPNGKIDRKALPRPQSLADAPDRVLDTTMDPLQRRMAGVWRDVLQRDHVGLHANFFDMGGHSLLLVKLQAAIRREFSADLSLVELFQHTTIAAQTQRVTATAPDDSALRRAQARIARQLHV